MTEPQGTSRDSLMQSMGELKGDVRSIGREVSELRANAVTKEYLEAKIGPTNKFVYGLIAAVLGLVLAAVVSGVISRGAPSPPVVNVIVPTPTPVFITPSP